MKPQMTAAVLYGKEDVKIEKVPIPTLEPGEVLVKVNVALTCGTDLKVFQRGYHARMIVPPALFGHELSGVIEEVGPGVRDFRRGMKVVALNSAPCGSCFYCLKHQENLCEDLLFNNGAYAEYIRIPGRIVETNMLALPDDVSFESAALTEPLACALRGLQETAADIGDIVTVIGAGPLGLMLVRVAKLNGCKVIAVVKRDEQVAAAKHLGADDVVQIDKVESPVDTVIGLTEGRGSDIVIEAVGRPQAWQWAVDMVRRGGGVNFFDDAGKFVPEERRRHDHACVVSALIDLQVGATSQRDLHLDQDFPCLNVGDGDFFNFHVLFTVEDGCCHLSVHCCLSRELP